MLADLAKTRQRLQKQIRYRREEKKAGFKEYRAGEVFKLFLLEFLFTLASLPFYLFRSPQKGFQAVAGRKGDETWIESYFTYKRRRKRALFYLAVAVAVLILLLIVPRLLGWLDKILL